MEPFVGIFFGGAFIIVVPIFVARSFANRLGRTSELSMLAMSLGLEFSPKDPEYSVAVPLEFLRRGELRRFENVLAGVIEKREVKIFDFSFEDTTVNVGNFQFLANAPRRSFSCALVQIPLASPEVKISRETISTRIADHVGAPDVQLEWEEFNRRFEVQGFEPLFTSTLLDARMMGFLMDQDRNYGYEVMGPYVLCWAKKLPALAQREVLDAALGFVVNIPGSIWVSHGERGLQ